MISQQSLLKRTYPTIMQCAQAHRKPRWLPVAKSKVYRIPKRPEVSEEERLELLRINNNYKTQMRAIKRFYHEEMIKEKSTKDSAGSEMSIHLEAQDWKRCVELNEKWNAQVALERVERRKQELVKMEEYALEKMMAKDRELEERIKKASEQIRKQKELSTTFITLDNVDAAIDHALANPVDYNFVIDSEGNQIIGRDTPVPPKKSDRKPSTSV